VHWHNHERLHDYLDDLPPVEFDGMFRPAQQGETALVEIKG
jgi:putative transposase